MIKPIETIYKGYRFRSRLEARWAVFFDALNIPWEYEKEGFDIDGEWYLPDFYLPNQKTYIEIKPNKNGHSYSFIDPISFYCAGKITKMGWRNSILWDDKVFGYHNYTGPFMQELEWDHCGLTNGGEIYSNCIQGIQNADILFIWLNTPYVHATLGEIGYAKGINKKIWLGISNAFEEIHGEEYWFFKEMADDFTYSDGPAEAIKEFIYRDYVWDRHIKYNKLSQKDDINSVFVIYGNPGINEYYSFDCRNQNQGFLHDQEDCLHIVKWLNYENDSLGKALLKAKQARFEHGEKG